MLLGLGLGLERCFFFLSRACDKEKIPSTNEESNRRPLDPALRCSNHWATETPRWAKSITTFIWQASCILLRSAMSKSVMFVDINKRDDKFSSIGAPNPKVWGLTPYGNSEFFLFFLCPTLVIWRKNIFLYIFTELKNLPSLFISRIINILIVHYMLDIFALAKC